MARLHAELSAPFREVGGQTGTVNRRAEPAARPGLVFQNQALILVVFSFEDF